jgi:hypothetical protein
MQRKGAVALCSWTPQESQVERCEHQDDSNIHCQPFQESVSEEHEIYTDDDACHRHNVKRDSYLSAHFSPCFNRSLRIVQNPDSTHRCLLESSPSGQIETESAWSTPLAFPGILPRSHQDQKSKFSIFRRAEEVALILGHPPGDKLKLGRNSLRKRGFEDWLEGAGPHISQGGALRVTVADTVATTGLDGVVWDRQPGAAISRLQAHAHACKSVQIAQN